MKQPRLDDLLDRGLKLSHLRLMAALRDVPVLGQAAARVGVSQPAASRLLAEIERLVGTPVHERTGRGLSLTAAGDALAQRAQRVLMELRDAARDIAEAASGGRGHVRIGAVTGPAIDRVLPVLRAARLTAPGISAEVTVAPSDILTDQLLAGRLDFVIGRLPEGPDIGLFGFDRIASEPVALVVRRGHPLVTGGAHPLADLMNYDWVMPPPESLLTRRVVEALQRHGLPMPVQRLSTASFLMTLVLLNQSNAIAPLARAVGDAFSRGPDGPYVMLPIDLGFDVDPFGLVTLSRAALPPAAAYLAREIRAIVPPTGPIRETGALPGG